MAVKVFIREGSGALRGSYGFLAVKDEVMDWLNSRHISYRYGPVPDPERRKDCVGYLFEIADDTSALLFKLTWG